MPRAGYADTAHLAAEGQLGTDRVLGEHALLPQAYRRAALTLRQLELAQEATDVAAPERLLDRALDRGQRIAAEQLQ